MATLHGYVNTMRCACTDVDSYNCAGVYASGDLDNAVMVTLGDMTRDGSKNIEGFEFAVTPATGATTNADVVWMVASPEVGSTIEMQELADPRYFYNEAGKPMSLKYLVPGIDTIEVTKEAFANKTLPDGTTNQYAVITDAGKLAQATADPGSNKIYFKLLGFHTITFGMTEEKTAVLRRMR